MVFFQLIANLYAECLLPINSYSHVIQPPPFSLYFFPPSVLITLSHQSTVVINPVLFLHIAAL
ncbi:hypothetical protein ACTXT7_011155 [Hymenolepis weldensis]